MKSTVTVLVCAYNDDSTIDIVLQALERLTYRPLEILVIDDASTDRTAEILKRFPVVSVRNEQNRGLGHNLNLGLKLAQGEYLAVVQSDCEVLEPDWLDRMMEPMADPSAAVVVSQREIDDFARLPAGARLFNAVAPQELKNKTGALLEQRYCRGKADLYRLAVLRDLNGWNTAFFTAGEDTDLSIRLRKKGYKILLHPEARVRYLFSGRQRSVGGALRKAFLYGRTARILYRIHRYDGIQARVYLLLLLAVVAWFLPFPLYSGILLLIFSLRCRIQTAGGKGFAFAVPAIAACAGIYLLHRFCCPGIGLGSIPLLGILTTGGLYLFYLSAKNAWANHLRGEPLWRLPATFVFCIFWRLLSGAGYLAGFHHRGPKSAK